jgi:hypothetical protein
MRQRQHLLNLRGMVFGAVLCQRNGLAQRDGLPCGAAIILS